VSIVWWENSEENFCTSAAKMIWQWNFKETQLNEYLKINPFLISFEVASIHVFTSSMLWFVFALVSM